MCECSGGTSLGSAGDLHLSHFCKRGHWHDKKPQTWRICFLLASSPIWLKTQLVTKQNIVCTPSLHLGCALHTLSKAPSVFHIADCFESLTINILLSHKESLQTGGPENASSGTLWRNTSIMMKNMQARVQSCCQM